MSNFDPFFHLFSQVSRSIQKKRNEILSPLNLFYSQWSILFYLKEHGPSTLVGISNYLFVEKPTITRTVKRLEESGLVHQIDTADRRERCIDLTPYAREHYEEWRDHMRWMDEKVLDGIPEEEIANAQQFLSKVMNNLNNMKE